MRKKQILLKISPLLFVILLLVLWQAAVSVFHIPDTVLPSPVSVLYTIVFEFGEKILPDFLITAKVFLVGFLISFPLGILIAGICSQFNLVVKSLTPIIIILMNTPMLILVPVLQLFMGFDPKVKIIVVALQAAPVIALSSLTGFTNVSREKINLMKSMGANRWQVFSKLVFLDALPEIFSGLRLGCLLSIIAAVGSDMSVGQDGLGYRIKVAASFLATDTVFASIIVCSLLGFLLFKVIDILEKSCMKWK